MTASKHDHRVAIQRLLDVAKDASPPELVATYETAVSIADTHHDTEAGYELRMELMNAALNCGKADTLLVAFTWCAAMAERHPEMFDQQQVLWWNRWAVIYAPTFPSISAERIHAALAAMDERYRKAGASLRTVHWVRWKVAFEMGDKATARSAFRAMKNARPDWLGPDPDTEEVMHLEYWGAFRQYANVIDYAQTLLQQNDRCFYKQQIRSWAMIALLQRRRWAEAMAYHVASYRPMLREPSVVIQASRHVAFLGVTCHWQRAFRLIERYLPYCVTSDPQDQFELYSACELLLRCAAKYDKDTIRLRLPTLAPGFRADGQYATVPLADAFRQATLVHVQRFDARNGNDHYAQTHEHLQLLLRLTKPYPLPT